MKKNKSLIYLLIGLLSTSFISCFEDQDDEPIEDIEIKDFVWKAMNLWYFWQSEETAGEVNNLADDRFASVAEYTNYLNSFSNPEQLFEDLKFSGDRFSFITDNYFELNNALGGTTKNTGMEFGLVSINGGPNVLGYVQYVLPNSDAEAKNIKRGDLFTTVNGIQLTENNFSSLLFSSDDTYTIGLAFIDVNSNVVLNGETKTLTKTIISENPIHIANTFTVESTKVGYLMYNRFIGSFDESLNAVFGQFIAEGVQELVLDLRYNPGGSVNSAINLSSMIAGQPETDLFLKQRWNDKLQEIFVDDSDRFFTTILPSGVPINSLNLDKVYILAQRTSASASELVINGLTPYVNEIIHIGNTTRGKNEFSITLFDIPDCGFLNNTACDENPNPNHTLAIQPLVGKNENADGFLDFEDGFTPLPQFILDEDLNNLGVLGDQTEPLLARAIQHIIGNGRLDIQPKLSPFTLIDNSNAHTLTGNNMYVEPKFKPNF